MNDQRLKEWSKRDYLHYSEAAALFCGVIPGTNRCKTQKVKRYEEILHSWELPHRKIGYRNGNIVAEHLIYEWVRKAVMSDLLIDPLFLEYIQERHLKELGRELISTDPSENEAPSKENYKEEPTPKDSTTLHIIGALTQLYWEKYTKKNPLKLNQSTIIQNIIARYPKAPGLSQRTLEQYLSKGLSSIADTIKETAIPS